MTGIKRQLQASIQQLNLLRDMISLRAEDEGWNEADKDWAMEHIYKYVEWLEALLQAMNEKGCNNE